MKYQQNSTGAPAFAGRTTRFRKVTGAQDNLRIQVPAGAAYVGIHSVENAVSVEVDDAARGMTAALDDDCAVELDAGNSLPAMPVDGGEIIRITAAEAVGDVILAIEGVNIPRTLEIDETAP